MSRTSGGTVAFLNNLMDLAWFLSFGFFCVCVCVMVTVLRSWNRNKAFFMGRSWTGCGVVVSWLCQEKLFV